MYFRCVLIGTHYPRQELYLAISTVEVFLVGAPLNLLIPSIKLRDFEASPEVLQEL